MEPAKRQRLEAAGWTVGDASDFLGLRAEEAAFIELKLALSKRLKQQRESQQLTQQALANGLSRVNRGLPKWKLVTRLFRSIS
jgi:hypothetical protein